MRTIISMVLTAVFLLTLPVLTRAEVVGRFQKVAGPVDLLKQGNLPVVTAKVGDGVEPGDVIRTKSKGRAQVKFVDDSMLTIAPGSRVAVDTYMYDASKGARKAILQVFRGMVQTVVTRILKTREPNFIMKTHTAVLGVRGTKWYTLLGPNATDVYNEEGRVCIRNIYAEVKGEVCLNPMEFSRVTFDLTPTTPMPFQKQDLAPLEKMLVTGSAGVTAPTGMMSLNPLPLAFLDNFSLFTLKSGVNNLQLAINRQPIIGRDFLRNRDRDLLNRLPGIIDRPRPGIDPGSRIPGLGGRRPGVR